MTISAIPRWLAGLLGATCATAIWAQAGVTVYRGLCDASAAVALGPGHFIVADDERNVLSIHRVGSAVRADTVDLSPQVGDTTPGGKIKEVDIEGAARIGDRIYWIGSHGRDKKGDKEPTRRRLFATQISDPGSVIPGVKPPARRPYETLLADLAADARFRAITEAATARVPPEHAAGLSIEGLAATRDGELMIGLRNPRPNGQALLVTLQNPAEVVDAGARPRFGAPVTLDLGQRGIRSIEWVDGRFVIVAGPFDDGEQGRAGSDFALYTWSGIGAEAPKRWQGVDLGSLAPEALFALPNTRKIHLLSDDGRSCKDKSTPDARRTFRGITLELPPA